VKITDGEMHFIVKKNICFDIGSNIGNWTKANLPLYDKIIAIEASEGIFDNLKINFENNNKVECINYAVCNNNGNDITFFEANINTLSTLNKDWLVSETSRFFNTSYKEVLCKTVTIDTLISQYGIPTLIKIDVEGGEFECISSLTSKIKQLCFERASEVNHITFKCIDHLVKIGFNKFYVQFEDYYLFRPDETDYTDNDTIKKQLLLTIPKKDWGMIWCK